MYFNEEQYKEYQESEQLFNDLKFLDKYLLDEHNDIEILEGGKETRLTDEIKEALTIMLKWAENSNHYIGVIELREREIDYLKKELKKNKVRYFDFDRNFHP